jgi:hypothetical protein
MSTVVSRVCLIVCIACVLAGCSDVLASAAGTCPNETLRQELHFGELPDCRAYEMVSPVFKGGSVIKVEAVSEDGSRVIGSALGGFAGTESDPYNSGLGAIYELARTAGGWTAMALDPPASMSPELKFFGAERGLSRTLWGLRGYSQSIYEQDLYVREPNGSFVKVGPLVPPARGAGPAAGTSTEFGTGPLVRARFAGASADLSHVVVKVLGFNGVGVSDAMWPGDGTLAINGANSIYEYTGTGLVRPTLVGVNDEGVQITDCGTELGNAEEGGDKYNAISASGERIFFTAKAGGCVGENEKREPITGAGPTVNELYARVNALETVDISEPTRSQCGQCQTAHSETTTTEKPAQFWGASEDGSKVFFTTEQELLPGQKGSSLYEYDFDNPGSEKIIAIPGSPSPEVQGVARVSEDGSHVYFVAKGVLAGEENAEKTKPIAGQDNLYVFERDSAHPHGRVTFIATLAGVDAELDWGKRDERSVQATPDGRYLVFVSAADLTPDDTSTARQVFEYDSNEERLVRISVGQVSPEFPMGYNGDGNTTNAPASIRLPQYISTFATPTIAESQLNVSADGAYVFFVSADALTPQAVEVANAKGLNVYEYHSTGSIADGNVYLISDGKDTSEKGLTGFFSTTDASGNDVFFRSSDALTPQDQGTEKELYDARMNGGLAEPARSLRCEGEACLGSPASISSPVLPASISVLAGGDLPANTTSPPVMASKAKSKPKPRPLSRAQLLARALRACAKGPRRNQAACRRQARRRYTPTPNRHRKGKI